MIKLSILIPTLKSRSVFLERLDDCLAPQRTNEIEVIKLIDQGEMTIGKKRNWLLNKASGEYVSFIDDDDIVSENYINLVMEGIEKGVDCCSLTGIITDDGKNPRTFIHSIRYNSWFEKDGKYFRPPNHLNVIKASIAKRIAFREISKGEDHKWSIDLLNAKLIKTEHWIEDVLYYYQHRNNK